MAPIWSVLPMEGNSVYKALWTKVTGLMGLGSHGVTFQLARFWFILATLVTRELFCYISLPSSQAASFLNKPIFLVSTPPLQHPLHLLASPVVSRVALDHQSTLTFTSHEELAYPPQRVSKGTCCLCSLPPAAAPVSTKPCLNSCLAT